MSRTELFEIAEREFITSGIKPKRLNFSSACYVVLTSDKLGEVVILKSYDTIVAVYLVDFDIVVVRDRYSTTTSRHCSDFAKLFYCNDMLYCYKRSDNVCLKRMGKIYKNKDLCLDFDYALVLEAILTNKI